MHVRLASVVALILLGLATAPTPSGAQTAKERPKAVPLIDRIASPYEAERPIADKLRSPRETLKTLYFAVITYDLFPKVIDDAVACLDLDAVRPRPAPEDAALMAFDLEYLLQTLALPLRSIPDQSTGTAYTLYDAGDVKLALHRGSDGGWRFDAATLGQLQAMCRAARARPARPAGATAAFRDGFTDPRAMLRQFISDAVNGDFYAAARALDLSSLSDEQRREQGPALAQQMAFVLQRRGYVFRQEIPDQPNGPPYIWHADAHGRIVLDRVRQADGKDAWLFTRLTVRNIPRMYAAAQALPVDSRYARLKLVIPTLATNGARAARKRPEEIPPHLGSPRALLQGFFRAMDTAESNDARLADALEYLDLEDIPAADRAVLGTKLAAKLEAVLRKLPLDLRSIPDTWNAPPQTLGDAHGAHIEILRARDGCWRFSKATMARVPEMFDRLAGKGRFEAGRGAQMDSARDTLITFQTATQRRDFALAATCLDLSEIHPSAREEVGSVLALKLKYVIDRISRVYIQEVPDNPAGPRYVLYRGELGRIALDRMADGSEKGSWRFTAETVRRIEAMFGVVSDQHLTDAPDDTAGPLTEPDFWTSPGVWLRLQLPDWMETQVGAIGLYQWVGCVVAALVSWGSARLAMLGVALMIAWVLRRSGSALSNAFVAATLRPFTWLTAVWIFFLLLRGLDLPIAVAGNAFAVHKFLLAALFGWLGVRLIDLSTAIYLNSELLRPHRSLADMIVPVSMRIAKGTVLLVVATYVIYEIGEIDLLARFLTGLGVAGLAASLAAQDAMKSFFGTLLLIGERAFKIGDRINVGGTGGVVEQVGFRSTLLRTDEGSLLTVPNAAIAAAPIDNLGARSHLRYSTTIDVSPETPPDRLLEFCDQLRGWLTEQPLVDRDKVNLHVHQITSGSVELSLSVFLATKTGADETHFREATACHILQLASQLGVELAPAYARHAPVENIAAADGGEAGSLARAA